MVHRFPLWVRALRTGALGGWLAICLTAAACTAPFGLHEDAPAEVPGSLSWPLFRQGLTRTGRSPATGPATPQVRWTVETAGPIRSSPVIGPDGTIYVGSEDMHLYAVRPDGQVAYKVKTEGPVRGAPAVGPDGTVYVGSLDAHLYAVAPDGAVKWKVRLGHDVEGLSSAPAVTREAVYVNSTDKYLYALSPESGAQLWRVPTWEFSAVYDPWEEPENDPGLASPAVAPDGTIYVGSFGEQFLAITPGGQVKWKTEVAEVTATPAIADDGTVYLGSLDDQTFRAFGPDGQLRWTFTADGFIGSSAAVGDDGTVYFGTLKGTVYALGPDGKEKWTYAIGAPVLASPALAADGTLYVAAYDGFVYALSPEGELRWKVEIGGQIDSSPALGPDGTLYIGGPDGRLYAIGSG